MRNSLFIKKIAVLCDCDFFDYLCGVEPVFCNAVVLHFGLNAIVSTFGRASYSFCPPPLSFLHAANGETDRTTVIGLGGYDGAEEV